MSNELLPCPFCGHDTPEMERIGSPRQSCIVACGYCGARHESSDEGSNSGSSWNTRTPPTKEGQGQGEKPSVVPMPAYIYGHECSENEKVLPLAAVEAYADARVAEATRELVDGLQQAKHALDILWLSHHANRTDAAIEKCGEFIAKYTQTQKESK